MVTLPFRCVFLLSAVLMLARCSSTPSVPTPSWVTQPTRTIDAGYLVYVGFGDGVTREQATLNAESAALSDLANECSFVPKGARVEDRFDRISDNGQFRAAAKIGTTFEECEAAKKADTPEAIKALANEPMNAMVKHYQETYFADQVTDSAPTDPDDDEAYLASRQQLVWQKQQVIFAPAGTYVPGSVAYNDVVVRIRERIRPIYFYENQHPQWTVHAPRPPSRPMWNPGGTWHGPIAVPSNRPSSGPQYRSAPMLSPAHSAPAHRPAPHFYRHHRR